MHDHDRIYLSYKDAKPLIQEGDLLLYRGKAWYSFFIKHATRGNYSHIGLASWHNGTTNKPAILETIEFHGYRGGGSTLHMSNLFPKFSEQIDVYRTNPTFESIKYNLRTGCFDYTEIKFDGLAVTNTMRELTGLPYGWRRIWWFIKSYMLFWRFFYNLDDLTSDEQRDIIYPVCSTAIAYSFSYNGFDLIREKSNEWTQPSDIAQSPMTNYLFSIV